MVRSRRNNISIFSIVGVTALAMGIFVFLFWYGPTFFGSASTLANNFLQLFPGILLFSIGMVVVVSVRGMWAVPAMFMTGIGLCVLLGTLDNLGAISEMMLSGLTLNEIYTWVVVMSGLFGAIIAAVTVKN